MQNLNKHFRIFEKGQAVIVGSDIPPEHSHTAAHSKQWQTDSVVVYDASCLSISGPMMLGSAKLSEIGEDLVIYLCGHGSRRKMTIDGRKMKEIAVMLKAAGYTGKQKIIIMSCHAKSVRKWKDMAHCLRSELAALGIAADVEVFARGTTVITQETDGTAAWDLQISAREDSVFRVYQNLLLKKIEVSGSQKLTKKCCSDRKNAESWNRLACSKKGLQLLNVAANCVDRITSIIVALIIIAAAGSTQLLADGDTRLQLLAALFSYILLVINRLFKIDRPLRPLPVYFLNSVMVSYSLISVAVLLIRNQSPLAILAAAVLAAYAFMPVLILRKATKIVAAISRCIHAD